MLDGWQADALELFLSERPGGKWAAFEAALIVPRQNGKGSVLEAIELAALFLFGERLILHSAHEFKTAQEAFLRVLALIQQTPDLDRLVRRVRTSHGEEGIELRSGQRLRFVARSRGSGRGFSGDRVILDEAYNLPSKALAALMPTLSAMPNPQLVYTSSAPLVSAESDLLRRLCERGRVGSPRLAYVEYSADPEADLDDPDAWAAANPSFPGRVSAEAVEVERVAMPDEDFARERLGIWRPDENVVGPIPAEAWEACRRELTGEPGPLRFALDVDVNAHGRPWATVGVSDGRLLEVVTPPSATGVNWVVPACVRRLAEIASAGGLHVDPSSPAGMLIDELESAGVPLVLLKSAEVAEASQQLVEAVLNREVTHRGQPDLTVAAVGAQRKDVGDGAWRFSRKVSTVDISPLMAVMFARWAAVQADVADPALSVH